MHQRINVWLNETADCVGFRIVICGCVNRFELHRANPKLGAIPFAFSIGKSDGQIQRIDFCKRRSEVHRVSSPRSVAETFICPLVFEVRSFLFNFWIDAFFHQIKRIGSPILEELYFQVEVVPIDCKIVLSETRNVESIPTICLTHFG